MMPLVDPRRASSHAETEAASRSSLSHRLSKIAQCEISRTKAVDGSKLRSHPKKPEKQVSAKDRQHLLQQQQQSQKQLQAKVSQSGALRSTKEGGKDSHCHRGSGSRNSSGKGAGVFPHPNTSNKTGQHHTGGNKGGKGSETWDLRRLEEESEVALERRRQQLTQELMREMAGDSHHHIISVDKKMHGQHGHRRNPSSSSSSSSSSTSSSTSSSSSSSTSESSPHRSGYKRDSKRKSRPGKRIPSSSDRLKLKKTKSSSSSRKHSSSKNNKKNHPSKKDHEKIRGHKSSRSPARRKSLMSKKILSPGRKRTPSPSRKSHKLSPGRAKRSKSRKRSGSPRDRLEYRSDRIGLPERSLSHGRDANMVSHAASSSRTRDPRVDERARRISPEQIGRDRYRYEKERLEEYVEPRRERRSPAPARSREVERKETHRHRDYERHEREHYDERRREDPRREEREREQLRERELREREMLRERELVKERERVEILEREQERERERIREVDDRRSRYGREHEFAREREVVVRGGGREFEGERDFYSPRVRPELDARVLAVDDRRPYDEAAYERFQSGKADPGTSWDTLHWVTPPATDPFVGGDKKGIIAVEEPIGSRNGRGKELLRVGERERVRYESGRSRYDELALHERRGIPPIDDRRADRRAPPLDARFPDERRRASSSIDPRVHEAWVEEHRGLDRMERADHFPPHVPPPRHRHQPDWTGGRPSAAWDRHKHARHEEWADEYGRVAGASSGHGAEWGEEHHDWVADRAGPASLHQDQWGQHPRRSYRDEWGARESEWGDRGLQAYSGRDLGHPGAQGLSLGRDRGLQPPIVRRPRREPIDQGMEPPPPAGRHHLPAMSEEEGVESALVPPRGGDIGSPPHSDQDQALMPGNDGELWEYDPGRGSWVRRAADAPPRSGRESPGKKEKPLAEVPVVEESEVAAVVEDKKRAISEDKTVDEPESKRLRTESPTPVTGENDATLQEKDTFSDISDDVDDILNQEVGGYNEEDGRNLSSSQIEDPRNLNRENGPTYDDLLDEDEEAHLEEISDDELEEDRQAKFNVAGALDINWALLVRDSSRAATNEVAAGTALKRFSASHLLARLGVSTSFARPEVLQQIKEACSVDTNQEDTEPKKIEIPPVIDSGGVLRLLKARAEDRQRILDGIGPNRRALCARQDIALRRQLCNLPKQDLIGYSPLLDKDLFRQSISLLKSC
nr:zinc finger CCCH domain-containing protein 13-like isoform X1 [Procambarus clarkii]XP_045611617.1 zinc finger CCCH domain-containing protein 13-like isoform X1 [Procambarus clarkii]XP_045611618.1 zinc finger CCCH domain-containing protein 13-like isoform X1 [Procambarus clarkii]XP_045611619.1 zinc finger CCCH domain-containing protein 13-like isoform X1 [Procambarus clarkii]